jgi:hypothetical protein
VSRKFVTPHEGRGEMTQAGVRSAILIPNRGVLFLVTVIRLMITGLTSYRKGKEPTNMEIAAITLATLILLTTRYETHCATWLIMTAFLIKIR